MGRGRNTTGPGREPRRQENKQRIRQRVREIDELINCGRSGNDRRAKKGNLS